MTGAPPIGESNERDDKHALGRIKHDFPLGARCANLRPNLLAPLCVFELAGS